MLSLMTCMKCKGKYHYALFNVKIMQEVWWCEGKNVFLQYNSVKRLKGERLWQ